MTGIEARVARLEAAEAIRGAFAQYTHFMDGGFVDKIIDLFSEDAGFVAKSEPPGTGGTVELNGRSNIGSHYRSLNYGRFRHHTTNTSIDISADAQVGELSSLFITTYRRAIKGGLYELRYGRNVHGQWKIANMHIVSSWGWNVDEDGSYFEPFSKHTLRDGHPVVWGQTLGESD